MKAIHMTQALAMLDRGAVVDLTVVTGKGRIMRCENVISLRYDHYGGTRTIKFTRSGQKRTIHDTCIIAINDFEVYL